MKIAIEGCAHGELEKIYDTLQLLEQKENVKVDVILCNKIGTIALRELKEFWHHNKFYTLFIFSG